MSYISNRLVHWAGSRTYPDERYLLLTRDILQRKRLRFGKCPWDFGSERGGLKEQAEAKVLAICFADIPFSETEAHCEKYSRFGISFDKSYLANCFACPVGYIQNPFIHENFSYIYAALKAVEKRLPKVTVDSPPYAGKVVTVEQILSRFMYMIAFAKNYSRKEYRYNEAGDEPFSDQKEFFEDSRASYFEREWRMVLSNSGPRPSWITPQGGEPAYFSFKEKYMGPIIMPRNYIERFNEERDEVLAEYDKNSRPPVLAYEDLRFM
jgi:hypothetical protein